MCLALVALGVHPHYPLVVAANRDEYHARPTAAAAWWPERMLAGRDLRAGGTWLGLTRQGRFALLTNVRNPNVHNPRSPSRGGIVPSMLTDSSEAPAIERILEQGSRYNGFNVIAGSSTSATWTSNRATEVKRLGRGTWALSNALLGDPWPKLCRIKD
ncbi:MAG TPA: NRDE family protein, partial [Casimicrobiaceae bacterium]|nr:NRDE family protein [Casimicrobiaceae bacterium]